MPITKISTRVCVHKGKSNMIYLINCEQKRNSDETVTKISCFVSITNIRCVLERHFKAKCIWNSGENIISVLFLPDVTLFVMTNLCSRNLAEYYSAKYSVAITLLKFGGWRLMPNFSRRIYGAGQKFGGYSNWRWLGGLLLQFSC